ncbi:hypothetical protein [Pseudomonas sp. PS02290]|uniref:hypothetical protein n=1 Tax=Pseudomonas sp. PS02290 TaxID=2991430 RepID=UPI00249C1829|nr:hypothetical protein [Pseudomonas sp. PS02290]
MIRTTARRAKTLQGGASGSLPFGNDVKYIGKYQFRSVLVFNNLTKTLAAEIDSIVSMMKLLERDSYYATDAVIDPAPGLVNERSSMPSGVPLNYKLAELNLRLDYLKEVLLPSLNMLMIDVVDCMESEMVDEQCITAIPKEELRSAAISMVESCVPMLEKMDTDLGEMQVSLKCFAQTEFQLKEKL